MKVKTSTNVISHCVSSALKFLAGALDKPAYKTTAWFLDQVKRWFYLMTSRNPTCAISKMNPEVYNNSIEFLKNFMDIIRRMEVGYKRIWKPSQTGVLVSTESLLKLQAELLENRGYDFILTSRFSQDCLENLFSSLIAKQIVPNALQVKNNLKLIAVSQYLKNPTRSSYEEDDHDFLPGFLDSLHEQKPVYKEPEIPENLPTPALNLNNRYVKTGKHSSSTLALTYTPKKKDLHVQLEEDEKPGFETFALSASSSQVEVDLNSPRLPDDNRETWTSNMDFLLSIIGFAVDLANIWRFPYLCYRNGGGAFLVPYTLMLAFGAVPLFYMELVLGQFNRQGPVSVWRICPLFKGVGFCAVLVAFYVSFYYNVIIAWALYFLGTSISAELPWIHCNNSWNTGLCWEKTSNGTNTTSTFNETAYGSSNKYTPAAEFFTRKVLEVQFSEGLQQMGYPKWQLVICLLVVYSMLYISLFKGVKSSGKVVWVTATMPYVVLSILLVRGLMLPGALKGISYYLKPELSKLKETRVWVDAAVQIFYSVGAGFGVHLTYASYNTFHNNCLRDCLVTTAVNCFTSFFSGFVIFTYLGFMSHKQQVPISSVAAEGPGLVFQVYPEAVATLPGSHIWSVLFFFMLIMLGLDSAMGGLECVITGLIDEFHIFFKWKRSREIFTFVIILMSFSIALINVTPGGIYMFHLFDTYSAGISLLCSALFEAIAVSWFYGLDKFTQDVKSMLGSRPGLYWRICWKFISPCFIIGVVTFGLIYHEPLRYIDYSYPNWAEWVGWSLALSSILMIPIVAIVQLLGTPGTLKERIAINISPVEEHEQLRENRLVSRFQAKHWLFV